MRIILLILLAGMPIAAQTTRTVCASGCNHSTVQAAINAAVLGDTIEVAAGETFTENITLPYKSTGSGWITIQSSNLHLLPAEGNRVSPSDAENMPKIQTNTGSDGSVVKTVSGSTPSHHYKFIGIHFARSSGLTGQLTALFEIGIYGSSQNTREEVPHDFVIDRCYFHGEDGRSTRRGLQVNGENIVVSNSYFSKFHENGADSQAIMGWNGTKNVTIKNNFLEAAGENIMFGGADSEASDLFPQDIVVEHNYLYKPLSWKGSEPGPVKNLLELKSAKNVTIRYNILENNWAHGQNGTGVLFTVRNQDNTAPWSAVEDVLFEYNIIKNSDSAFNILTYDDESSGSETVKNILIKNNLFVGSSSGGFLVNVLVTDANEPGENIVFDHNTFITAVGASGHNRTLNFTTSNV